MTNATEPTVTVTTKREAELLGALKSVMGEVEGLWDILNTFAGRDPSYKGRWHRSNENRDVATARALLASYGITFEG